MSSVPFMISKANHLTFDGGSLAFLRMTAGPNRNSLSSVKPSGTFIFCFMNHKSHQIWLKIGTRDYCPSLVAAKTNDKYAKFPAKSRDN